MSSVTEVETFNRDFRGFLEITVAIKGQCDLDDFLECRFVLHPLFSFPDHNH